MPIHELWLKDVGPIDEITFTFDPQVNVFIGPNNSGKSTVLAALGTIAVQSFEFPSKLVKKDSALYKAMSDDPKPESRVTVSGHLRLVEPDSSTTWSVLSICEFRRSLGYSSFVPAVRSNSNSRVTGVSMQSGLYSSQMTRTVEAEMAHHINEFASPHSDEYSSILGIGPQGEASSKSREEIEAESRVRDERLRAIVAPYAGVKEDVQRRAFPFTPTCETTNDRDFLQLIVDLDYRGYRESLPGIRNAILQIGGVCSEITDGFPVRLLGIKDDENGLFLDVQTPDGDLPFNALSQGTQSMVQWLAHLILGYAMYYDFAEDFADKPGVFIIDEIDAHLHPSWQRRILPTLTKHFPNLQIFCSTHSPLLIAGLKAGQIQLLRRKVDGGISITTNENDIIGWSADEIFSGFLDIPNPTDMETDKNLKRLEELQLKRERSPEEEKERQELRSEVPKALMNAPPPKQITELVDSLHEILQKRKTPEGVSKKTTRKRSRKSA